MCATRSPVACVDLEVETRGGAEGMQGLGTGMGSGLWRRRDGMAGPR